MHEQVTGEIVGEASSIKILAGLAVTAVVVLGIRHLNQQIDKLLKDQ